jgi:hypothetical protein
MARTHPADEFVQSAHQTLPKADEYLIDAAPPQGALIKAENPELVLEALKDGKVLCAKSSRAAWPVAASGAR